MSTIRKLEEAQPVNLYITLEENSDEFRFIGTIDPYHKGQDGLFCYISTSTELAYYIKQFQKLKKRFPIIRKMEAIFGEKLYTAHWVQIIDIGKFQSHNENAIYHNPENLILNTFFEYDDKLLNLCSREKGLKRHLKQVEAEKKIPKAYRFIDLRG